MKLTLFELQMIIDTLGGTLSICDNGNLFSYSKKQREFLVNSLLKRMNQIELNVSLETSNQAFKQIERSKDKDDLSTT